MARAIDRQFILIDGDDTLWEDHVYFEQSSEAFVEFLAHSSMRSSESTSESMATDQRALRRTSEKRTNGWPSATCGRTTSSTCCSWDIGSRASRSSSCRTSRTPSATWQAGTT